MQYSQGFNENKEDIKRKARKLKSKYIRKLKNGGK